jgi:hypothetical protein
MTTWSLTGSETMIFRFILFIPPNKPVFASKGFTSSCGRGGGKGEIYD